MYRVGKKAAASNGEVPQMFLCRSPLNTKAAAAAGTTSGLLRFWTLAKSERMGVIMYHEWSKFMVFPLLFWQISNLLSIGVIGASDQDSE